MLSLRASQVAAAALRGARALGVEIEPHVAALAQRALAAWAPESAPQRPAPACTKATLALTRLTRRPAAPPARRAAAGGRAAVRCGDATAPGALADATVVFVSLLPDGVAALAPPLAAARAAGARLVTLHFPLPGPEPPAATDAAHRLFYYLPLATPA